MTNADIIFGERMELMKQGKIGTTGRTFEVEMADGVHTFDEPEEIHTFAIWKQLGYNVKKGEHAIAKFMIWKCTGKKDEDDNEETRMFMKLAHFFSPSQVQLAC